MAKEKEAEKKEEAGERKRVILVPVDFSANALYALQWADRLAAELKAELAVLHVVHDPAENPGFYTRDKKLKKKWHKRLETFTEIAQEMMDEFLEEAREGLEDDGRPIKRAEVILVRGTVVSRIIEVAEKVGAMMIVLASHGRTKASRFLLGSKAIKAAQISPVPVTIVTRPRKPKE